MFIERKAGKIVGAYRVAQPGQAETQIADNDPELVAFLGAESKSPVESLMDLLVTKNVLSRADTDTIKRRAKP